MKLVVLTGIPGSGSTTILKKTLEEVDYLHLNYGDIMTEIAVEKGLVENRDELRKLPADTQKEIQKNPNLKMLLLILIVLLAHLLVSCQVFLNGF